jgi:hypothetical protein
VPGKTPWHVERVEKKKEEPARRVTQLNGKSSARRVITSVHAIASALMRGEPPISAIGISYFPISSVVSGLRPGE